MPSSDVSNIPFVVDELTRIDPTTILDVGVGFGKWGFLAREYLEASHNRLDPRHWRVRIDGIEIFEGYRNPTWLNFYDNLHIGDALEVIPTLELEYDVALACDVLEHVDRATGWTLIELLRRSAKNVIITTPSSFWSQDAEAEHNCHERHRSLWSWSDFNGLACRAVELQSTFGVIISDTERGEALTYERRLDSIGVRLLLRALVRRAAIVTRSYASARNI